MYKNIFLYNRHTFSYNTFKHYFFLFDVYVTKCNDFKLFSKNT